MLPTPRLERKQAFRATHNNLESSKSHCEVARRTSFTARMLKLILKRIPSADTNRPKSWSGRRDPALEVALEPLVRHTIANVIIPNEPGSSVRPASELAKTEEIQEESGDEGDECTASWRQQQMNCLNCERLFFTSLSTLCFGAGRFCSLDCKTTFEYVNHFQEVLASHMLRVSSTSSGSLDSRSDDDDFEVADFDEDQL